MPTFRFHVLRTCTLTGALPTAVVAWFGDDMSKRGIGLPYVLIALVAGAAAGLVAGMASSALSRREAVQVAVGVVLALALLVPLFVLVLNPLWLAMVR